MLIDVSYFKLSGKWYTNEVMEIPDEVKDFERAEYVRRNARLKDMYIVSMDDQLQVPILEVPDCVSGRMSIPIVSEEGNKTLERQLENRDENIQERLKRGKRISHKNMDD